MNRKRLKSQLIKHEGIRPDLYPDGVGKWTIGVGRNLSDGELSTDEIDFLLENDIARCEQELRERFPWFEMLSDPRQEVLMDMCFNLGINRLLGFKRMIRALEDHDYFKAADEMLDSQWAKQVGQRTIELSIIMRRGKYGE